MSTWCGGTTKVSPLGLLGGGRIGLEKDVRVTIREVVQFELNGATIKSHYNCFSVSVCRLLLC